MRVSWVPYKHMGAQKALSEGLSELASGARLLYRSEHALVFERRFYSDDPLATPEFESVPDWVEFVLSLRPPDPEHLTCPRTLRSDIRYLHHHLVVRLAPSFLRTLLTPEVERVLPELQPFVQGEALLSRPIYLLVDNPLLQGVVEALRTPPPVGSLRLYYEGKLRELVAFLCFAEPEVVATHDEGRLRAALEYLQSHLSDADVLQKVSERLCVSPRQCQRLFRVAMGCSPSEYLTELRMRRAATLLVSTNMSVSEIALEVGYLSLSHFSRVFRERFGKTPRAFRQNPTLSLDELRIK
ncbi:MAG: helix-turn-helix transcriptional regulator [Armatimonadota bacterium]|nr:helix-turn-helix transcriptional regulator [Armatimonadota bacterium]